MPVIAMGRCVNAQTLGEGEGKGRTKHFGDGDPDADCCAHD